MKRTSVYTWTSVLSTQTREAERLQQVRPALEDTPGWKHGQYLGHHPHRDLMLYSGLTKTTRFVRGLAVLNVGRPARQGVEGAFVPRLGFSVGGSDQKVPDSLLLRVPMPERRKIFV